MSGLLVARRGSLNPRRAAAGGGTYADEVTADSPSHWYRLQETSGSVAADSAGAVDGTVFGANLNVVGPVDGAADFDGTDDYIDAHGAESSLVDDFALEFWANTGTTVSNRVAIHAGSTSTTTHLWEVRFGSIFSAVDTKAVSARVRVGSAAAELIGNIDSAYGDGGWHHFVLTRTSGACKFYFDKTEVASVTAFGNPTIARFSIGRFHGGTTIGAYFDGSLSEIATYGTGLTAARVAAHYDAGVAA